MCLFASLFATIFWSGDIVNNGLVGSFRNANITLAICIAFMGGGVGAGIVGVATKLFSVTKAFGTFLDGMAELISVPSSWWPLGLWVTSWIRWAPASSSFTLWRTI